MFPIGHIASATLLGSLSGRRPSLLAAGVSQLPDVLDKPVAWVLRLSGSSHLLAHSLLGWLLFRGLAGAVLSSDKRAEVSDAYLSHLLADELHHGRVPWLYPFSAAKSRERDRSGRTLRTGMLLEIGAVAYLSVLMLLTVRHRPEESANCSD